MEIEIEVNGEKKRFAVLRYITLRNINENVHVSLTLNENEEVINIETAGDGTVARVWIGEVWP